MDAGRLDSRIALQRRTTSTDALGQPLDSWVLVGNVWANIRYLTGSATIKSDRQAATNRVSIRIRHRADVTPGMHAVWVSTTFVIQAVNPQGKEFLDLVCEVLQ